MITIYALSAFMPPLKGVIRDIRTVWTLEELNVPYQRHVMDATKGEHKAPEYLAINPFGKVPAMKDGNFTLFESTAICNYLGDKYGKLIPKPATKERAIYDQWVSFATSTLEPQVMRIFGHDFFTETKNETTEKVRSDAVRTVDGMFGAVDRVLAKQHYLAGESFSIADIIFSSICRSVGHTEIAAKHSHLTRYLEQNFARPAFPRAYANNG